jgi:hypothetical protein
MAELGNSRRISYKATYSQISGAANVVEGTETNDGVPIGGHTARLKGSQRAFEKTAFIQSLGIGDPSATCHLP